MNSFNKNNEEIDNISHSHQDKTIITNNDYHVWNLLRRSINENNFQTFELCINEKSFCETAALRPRLINETIKECQKNETNGCEFLEMLMYKLYVEHCYFECWQDTCKSVVRTYINKRKQFTPYTVYFLLRCYDAYLIRLVFEKELLDDYCYGNCNDWHLMFVASYQERFFAHCFDNIIEGFLSRYLLINKLRCSLNQRRAFLTWFAGSLHLYCDEYFLNKDEGRFKLVLIKVFEALILNGLLNNEEYKSLYEMLLKRNKEMMLYSVLNSTVVNSSMQLNSQTNFNNNNNNNNHNSNHDSYNNNTINNNNYTIYNNNINTSNFNYNINNMNTNSKIDNSNNYAAISHNTISGLVYFPTVESLYPLTLKNCCRLNIKRHMNTYTRKYIDKLPLPSNLKRFILFDNECESALKCCKLKPSFLLENDQIIAIKDCETQTDL